LADTATGSTDRRQLILEAAVRVFARKGFHAARVGDIAAEAGVAHGLLYHYFKSKDEVLETVFRETWRAMIDTISGVEAGGDPAREQLRKVSAIVLRTWKRDPDLVRVLVREVTRSPHLQDEVEEIHQAFAALQRIIERGQEAGELRSDLDSRLASIVFYGALEEILTAWVLGQLPDGEEDVARAEQTLVDVLATGLVAADVPAGA
jgi:TetR/AcrR family transcriptional regulator, fatty acid metabolism regulator protein